MFDTGRQGGKISGTTDVSQSNAGMGTENGVRIVITGKGGVGKTTITALLAHLFAWEGFRVLAIDGDPQQDLAVTMGVLPNIAKQIIPVSECEEYLSEKTGGGPGLSPGGFLRLNPDVSDGVDRFNSIAGLPLPSLSSRKC